MAITSPTPKLSIVMPTYRFDEMAQQAIRTLVSIADDNISVHVGDNSADNEKHLFLQNLAESRPNVQVSYHKQNIGWIANWLHLVRSQTAPYICLAADDDLFSKRYFSSALDMMMTDAQCSSACGLMVSFADIDAETTSFYTPMQRTEATPVERVRNYARHNSIAYAVMKTSVVKDFVDYVEHNPIKPAFNDYLLAFHLLSIGTFRIARRGSLYAYDDNKWYAHRNDYSSAQVQRGKYYVASGLPAKFSFMERLHWAVTNAHFFLSRYRSPEMAAGDAGEVAVYLYERMIDDFIAERASADGEIRLLFADHPEALRAVDALSGPTPRTIQEVVELFAMVLSAFSTQLANDYANFLKVTLLPEADAYRFGSGSRRSSWLRRWHRVS